MDWKTLLVFIVAITAVILWKRMSLISVDVARKYLREGASIVDVRSTQEFQADHLPNAVNVPLGELNRLPQMVKDKNQVLLLHCLSGTRSGMATGKIKGMGYSHVFNMGSLGRAKMITSGADSK
ncbi:MAG: rhodanese-like domain-containing protein [bacterium]